MAAGTQQHDREPFSSWKFFRTGEMAAKLFTMLLARKARKDAVADDCMRAKLRASLSAAHLFAKSFLDELLRTIGENLQPGEDPGNFHHIAIVRLDRLLATLQFASGEATRTSLPGLEIQSYQEVLDRGPAANDAPTNFIPPHSIGSIHDFSDHFLRFV